jgi:hypothetical protein
MSVSLDVSPKVLQPPPRLVSAVTGLGWSTPLQPSEMRSDDEPPAWERRDEIWTVEELLGRYASQQQEITIFNKGIEFVADQLEVSPFFVEWPVRIHEYAHANFHLGVDVQKRTALAEADVKKDGKAIQATLQDLTTTYSSVDAHVHEQIAQSITRVVLEKLHADAKCGDSARLLDTFLVLMSHQPQHYQLDKLNHLECDQLQTRLRALIGLIRDGSLRGNQKAWDTLMPW